MLIAASQTKFLEAPRAETVRVKVPYVEGSSSQLPILYPAIKKSTIWSFRGGHTYRNHQMCGEVKHTLECPSCGHQKKIKFSCYEVSCPECSNDWVKRTAKRVEKRFSECLRLYNIPSRYVSHVTFSPPQDQAKELLNLGVDGIKALKSKFNTVLKTAGAKGAVSVFHACRKEHGKWVLSPHFHVILVGYLMNSKEFYDRTRWVYKKIPDRGRRNAQTTMSYQLSHVFYYADQDGVRVGKYHLVSWHGDFSYNKVVIDYVDERLESERCPVKGCGDIMMEVFDYGVGGKRYEDFYIRCKYIVYKLKS